MLKIAFIQGRVLVVVAIRGLVVAIRCLANNILFIKANSAFRPEAVIYLSKKSLFIINSVTITGLGIR